MKKAILYLRAPAKLLNQEPILIPQAVTLGRYCAEHNIEILEVFYELDDDRDIDQKELDKMVRAIFERKLKPDYVLFTTMEVFSNNISNAMHLHHILAKYGVVTKAILQPNIVFATLPKPQK